MNVYPAACIAAALALAGSTIPLLAHEAKSGEQRQAPRASLAEFMERDLNAALTDISFELYHRRQPGQPVEMTPQLARALSRLSDASTRLGEMRTPDSDETSFQMRVVNLQTTVHGLLTAVITNDAEAEIHHWFNHVSAACEACHTEYKR